MLKFDHANFDAKFEQIHFHRGIIEKMVIKMLTGENHSEIGVHSVLS